MPHVSPAPPDAPNELQPGAGNPEQERGPTASPCPVLSPHPSPCSKAGQCLGAIRLSSIPEARRRPGQPKRCRAAGPTQTAHHTTPQTLPQLAICCHSFCKTKPLLGQRGISGVIKGHLGGQIKPPPKGGPFTLCSPPAVSLHGETMAVAEPQQCVMWECWCQAPAPGGITTGCLLQAWRQPFLLC